MSDRLERLESGLIKQREESAQHKSEIQSIHRDNQATNRNINKLVDVIKEQSAETKEMTIQIAGMTSQLAQTYKGQEEVKVILRDLSKEKADKGQVHSVSDRLNETAKEVFDIQLQLSEDKGRAEIGIWLKRSIIGAIGSGIVAIFGALAFLYFKLQSVLPAIQ